MSDFSGTMNNIKISTKIYISFALVIALLAVMSAFGVFGVKQLGGSFKDYRASTQQSIIALGLQEDFLEAEIAANRFRREGGEENAQTVLSNIEKMKDQKDKLENLVENPETLEALKDLYEQTNEYESTFLEAKTLLDQQDKLVDRMNEVGPEIRKALSKIRQEAYKNRAIEPAYYAGAVQEPLMLARFYAEQFLFSNDKILSDRVLAELKEAGKTNEKLAASVNNAAHKKLAEEVAAKLDMYFKAFSKVVDVVNQRDDYLINGLDKIEPKISKDMDILAKSAIETQDRIGEDAEGSISITSSVIIILAVLSLAFGGGAAVLIGRSLSSSIRVITKDMNVLSKGDLEIEIKGTGRQDEIGEMARALERFKKNAIEREEMRKREEKQQEAQVARAEKLDELFKSFENKIGTIVEHVSSASTELQATAGQMASSVEETGNQSESVDSSAKQANMSVQSVASASEELSAAISEVSKSIGQSAELARGCAETAESSQKELDTLKEAISEVDDIIASISEVAEQTNLLALNATIESARAGEAGKGFAVVASEVKDLANETHKMTEEITHKVDAVKESATRTIDSLANIISQIRDINESTSSVAASVEQQDKSTAEISQNAQKAATGTDEVTDNIQNIRQAATESGKASENVKTASDQLSEQAEDLRKNVEEFLMAVKAA